MKLGSWGLLLLLPVASRQQQAASQASNKPPEPDYIGVVAALDPSSNALIALERHIATRRIKRVFGGAEEFLEVSGERSPVRFKAGQKIELIARLESQQTDPQEALAFVAWKPDKGTRRLAVVKAGVFGSSGGTPEVPFDAVKYGEFSFKIAPTSPMQPGEYGFRYRGQKAVFSFCSFGVDPAPTPSQ